MVRQPNSNSAKKKAIINYTRSITNWKESSLGLIPQNGYVLNLRE